MNIAILIGRLTKDPELRYTQSGKAVANFSIAVDRNYTRGEEKLTDFFNIIVWGKTAENCVNYLAKGRQVAVKGSIENRSYETQRGEKRYITEIIADNVQFLERGDKNERSGNKQTEYKEYQGGAQNTFEPSGIGGSGTEYQPKGLTIDEYRELEDEDVPF